MRLNKLDPGKTGTFSQLYLDYINQSAGLESFYSLFPEPGNFRKQAEQKSFPAAQRELLVKILDQQYQGLQISPAVSKNIQSLKNPNTFTITTGHQLNLCTGPLYFIYKIFTAIKACEELNAKLPEYNFVPVYWMATEDHDIEEIDHFRVFGKTYKWNTSQKGPTGRLSVEGIKDLLDEVPDLPQFIKTAYSNGKPLAQAARELVNELFGQYGLLIVDADDSDLKRSFSSVLADELTNQTSFNLITETNKKLEERNYSVQVNPREINLFYMQDQVRERIVSEDSRYKVLNTEITFTTEELEAELDKHPERFSPNVILRPLYQEVILPNICYIGGPSELAYWLQMKGLFDNYSIPFPILLPRNFFLFSPASVSSRLHKTGMEASELFQSPDELKKNILEQEAGDTLSISEEEQVLEKVFASLSDKAGSIDPTLAPWVQAEKQKAGKQLENIARRLKKAEEQKHETRINQILNLREKLFPNGSLQERTDNFLSYFINNSTFLDQIYRYTEPFDFSFKILIEDE